MKTARTVSPHGTTRRYDCGCHCAECRAAKAAAQRRSRAGITNPPVATAFGAALVRRLLIRTERTITQTSGDLWDSPSYLQKCLARGRINVLRLDELACLLGCHMSELELAEVAA